MVIILYFTNFIYILKQKPSSKACPRITVAYYFSMNCYIIVGFYEHSITLIDMYDSSRRHRSMPIRSFGIAYNTVKDISIRD